MKKYYLPYINQHVETVIIANGEFPTHTIPLSILQNAGYLVCCDGAINELAKTGIVPDAIVGDCDSLSMENQERFANIIHRIKEQDTNDLTKAFNFCISQGKTNITILGATGKREDHTLGNISLICEYMRVADVDMITNHGIFVGIDESALFESYTHQQVSIFSIDRSKIYSHNLAYPIKNQEFTNWWQATLNEADGEEFGIDTDGRTIIYRTL